MAKQSDKSICGIIDLKEIQWFLYISGCDALTSSKEPLRRSLMQYEGPLQRWWHVAGLHQSMDRFSPAGKLVHFLSMRSPFVKLGSFPILVWSPWCRRISSRAAWTTRWRSFLKQERCPFVGMSPTVVTDPFASVDWPPVVRKFSITAGAAVTVKYSIYKMPKPWNCGAWLRASYTNTCRSYHSFQCWLMPSATAHVTQTFTFPTSSTAAILQEI